MKDSVSRHRYVWVMSHRRTHWDTTKSRHTPREHTITSRHTPRERVTSQTYDWVTSHQNESADVEFLVYPCGDSICVCNLSITVAEAAKTSGAWREKTKSFSQDPTCCSQSLLFLSCACTYPCLVSCSVDSLAYARARAILF